VVATSPVSPSAPTRARELDPCPGRVRSFYAVKAVADFMLVPITLVGFLIPTIALYLYTIHQ